MDKEEGRARRISHNTLYLVLGDFFSRLFTWALLAFLLRKWEVATYGQYSVVVNWVSIFAMFSDIGFAPLTVREVAHHRDKAVYYLRNVMVLKSAFSILFWGAVAATGFPLHYEPLLKTGMAVMGLRIVLDFLSRPYVYLLQAHEEMGFCALITVLSGAVRMVGIFAVVHAGGGIVAASWIWTLSSLISLVVLVWIGTAKGWKPQFPQLQLGEMKGVFKQAMALAPFSGLQFLYYRVDAVILKSLTGNEAAGFYDAATRLLMVTLALSQIYCSALYPVFSSIQDDEKAFSRLAFRAVKSLIFMSLPIMTGGFLLAGPLMVLIGGVKYVPAGPLFAILSLSVVPFFLSNIYVDILAVKSSYRLNAQFLILLVLNILLNFVLIPSMGALGAAWATVACEVFGIALGFWMAAPYLKSFGPAGLLRPTLAAMGASLAMGAGVCWDPRLYWLALGPVVYGLGLWLFRALDQDDWNSLKSILRLKKA